MTENQAIAGLRDEVRDPGFIGSGDRLLVNQLAHNQDRRVLALRELTDRSTGGESVHLGHHDVHEHEIGTDPLIDLQGLDAVLGLLQDET